MMDFIYLAADRSLYTLIRGEEGEGKKEYVTIYFMLMIMMMTKEHIT